MSVSLQFNRSSPTNSQGFSFNIEQLREEIEENGISVELEKITGIGLDTIVIQFAAALAPADDAALNGILGSHIPRDFGILVEGLTGEASGNVALASAELNWFDNTNTIFESHTVQDVIEEISSLAWLDLVDLDVLANAPILGNVGDLGETGATGEQGTQGNTGPAGDAGAAGNTGAGGATGSDGLVGSTGSAGNTGSAGATGEAAVGGLAGYEYHTDLVERSTTSNDYIEYTTMTTSSLEAGDYRIGWFYLWAVSHSNRDFHGRVLLDGSDVLLHHKEEPSQGSEAETQRHGLCGFVKRTLGAGVHTIKLEYKRGASPASSTIYEAHFELMKVN